MRCFGIKKSIALLVMFSVLAMSCPTFANTWISGKNLIIPRFSFGAEQVGGKIYAFGGRGINGNYTRTVHVFETKAGTWETKNDMPRFKSDFGTTILNGKIYAVGGYTSGDSGALLEEYDPMTDAWSLKKPLPAERSNLGVATVNNKIYAIGGQTSNGVTQGSVYEYDPVSNQWTNKKSMPTTRRDFGTGVVNGKIYAIGGYSSENYPNVVNIVEEYDPVTDIWTRKSSMPTARQFLQVEVIDGKIYAIGGLNPANMAVVECYDPAMDKWTTCEPMPTIQSAYFRTATLDGKIFVMGGYKGNYVSSDLVQIFAPTPSQPINLIAVPGNTQISLSWDRVESATGYNIKRSLTSGGPYETIGTTADTSFIDTTVTNGTTYYYVVTAVSSGGESQNSNEASATPYTDGVPTNLLGTWDGGILLSWDNVDGATGYNVKRSLTSGGHT